MCHKPLQLDPCTCNQNSLPYTCCNSTCSSSSETAPSLLSGGTVTIRILWYHYVIAPTLLTQTTLDLGQVLKCLSGFVLFVHFPHILCRLQIHKCESLWPAQEENQTFTFFLSSPYDTKLFDINNESRRKDGEILIAPLSMHHVILRSTWAEFKVLRICLWGSLQLFFIPQLAAVFLAHFIQISLFLERPFS